MYLGTHDRNKLDQVMYCCRCSYYLFILCWMIRYVHFWNIPPLQLQIFIHDYTRLILQIQHLKYPEANSQGRATSTLKCGSISDSSNLALIADSLGGVPLSQCSKDRCQNTFEHCDYNLYQNESFILMFKDHYEQTFENLMPEAETSSQESKLGSLGQPPRG